MRLPKSVKKLDFEFHKFPSKPNEDLFYKFLDHLKSLINLNSFKILNWDDFCKDASDIYDKILINLPKNLTSLHSNISLSKKFESSKPL